MSEGNLSIHEILAELRAHAQASGDVALEERVRQLEAALPGGAISVGNISGSTAVAIGSDIRIILNQNSNLPNELLQRLLGLADGLEQRLDSLPRASGRIRIFLASPGDVKDERQLALKAIRKIGSEPYYKNLELEAVAWDNPDDRTPLLAGIDPQHAINKGLAKPADCDICAVTFWSRMGTPLEHSRYQKAEGGQYLSGTEWELENALESFKARGLPFVLVYRREEKLLLDPDAPDFQEKARQWQLVKDFFARTQNPDGSIRLPYNTYNSPSEFGDLFEQHLRKLVARVAETKSPLRQPAPVKADKIPASAWPREKSPFPGLRAFGPADAPVFFGRAQETDHLLRRLSDPNCRFLAVVGASGSGKSSLVGAGLLPRLAEGALPGSEDWPVAKFTPDVFGDGSPFNALAWALGQPPFQMEPRETIRRLRAGPAGLRGLLEDFLSGSPDWKRVVLFIDQFEELFTRVADEAWRQEFCLLLSVAAQSPRILAVATMRDDFYHYCVKSPVLSKLINRNTDSTYTLCAPGLVELHEMVSGPARVAGLQFEPGLARRILDDTGSHPGALALMAYALDQLHKSSGGSGRLTLAAYQGFGGVSGAIGARAQETFGKLSPLAQASLPRVFRELLEVDENGTATRKRSSLAHVQQDEACRELAQALVEARLLVTSNAADNQPLLEVAHEALFRSWPELKAWIETAQDDLILLRQVRAAAALWEKQARKPAYLWPDERLRPVYAMHARLEPDLDESEQEFIRSEIGRLQEELENSKTTHVRRLAIGERLMGLGDPRPGVGLVRSLLPLLPSNNVIASPEGAKQSPLGATRLAPEDLCPGERRFWGDKPEHLGLPDLAWLPVPGGSIQIEKQTFKVTPFYIAKYPVTYRQFQAFIDDPQGFKNSRWWNGLAADEDHKSQPDEQNFKFDNHPRENVSWYDAVAFCRWLNARLGWQAPQRPEEPGLRLPTEWEWQWAAGGGQNLEYPWGKDWDGSRANTDESGLQRTTAVGMYPSGAAACGALDLSGNVWEWCLNEYEKPKNVGLGGAETRVLRGGSWYYNRDLARSSDRVRFNPGYRDYNVGFRVVVLPPSLRSTGH